MYIPNGKLYFRWSVTALQASLNLVTTANLLNSKLVKFLLHPLVCLQKSIRWLCTDGRCVDRISLHIWLIYCLLDPRFGWRYVQSLYYYSVCDVYISFNNYNYYIILWYYRYQNVVSSLVWLLHCICWSRFYSI